MRVQAGHPAQTNVRTSDQRNEQRQGRCIRGDDPPPRPRRKPHSPSMATSGVIPEPWRSRRSYGALDVSYKGAEIDRSRGIELDEVTVESQR